MRKVFIIVVCICILATSLFFLCTQEFQVVKGEPESAEETPNVKMRHYVITYDASDCPGMYAVRIHLIFSGRTRPADLVGLYHSLEEARKAVPEGLFRMPRDPRDDKVIVETWM